MDMGNKLFEVSILIVLSITICGCGEKYARQGELLSAAIKRNHEKERCLSSENCWSNFEVFGEHGNRVNINIYGVDSEKDISGTLMFVSENGLRITGGVPISLRFFREKKEDLLNESKFATPTQMLRIDK